MTTDNNVLQFRASDEGVAYVQKLMDEHTASRTQVLKAMFKVASQFPTIVSAVLAGEELNISRREALANAIAPVADAHPSGGVAAAKAAHT